MDAVTLTPPADAGTPVDLTGYTLVVPALGLGNVCQLAADLLVNTALVLRSVEGGSTGVVVRAGHLASRHVQAAVGLSPYSVPIVAPGERGSDAAVNCEVYVFPAAATAVMQQRAACLDREHELFIAGVAGWAARAGVAAVLVLTATDAILRPERMARGDRLVYLTSAAGGEDARAAAAAGATKYEAPSAPGGSDEDRAALTAAVERARATAAVAAAASAAASASASATVPAGAALSYYSSGGWLAHDAGSSSSSGGGSGGSGADGGGVPLTVSGVAPVGWEAPTPAAVAATATAFAALWGTGYAPVYFRRALSNPLHGVPTSVLALFASEGDNLADAVTLATAAAAYTGLAPTLARLPIALTHTLAQDDGTGSRRRKKSKGVGAGGSGAVGGGGLVRERSWPATGGFVVPPYFLSLFGPPVDLAAGSYGF